MATKGSGKRAVSPASKKTSVVGWHKWLALVYAVEGLSILLFSAVRSYPITISYLGVDALQSQVQGRKVLATGSQVIFNLELAWVVGIFLILAAIMHGLLASRLRPNYEKELKANTNMFRWIEYAVTTSILVVAVSLVAGVQDIAVLLMVLFATAIFNLLAMFAEKSNSSGKPFQWIFWLACAVGVLPWIAVKMYMIGGMFYGSVPSYVYWIEIVAFLLFVSIPINLYMQLRKTGNWANYQYSERMYIFSSLALKTVVAWVIFAAILRP